MKVRLIIFRIISSQNHSKIRLENIVKKQISLKEEKWTISWKFEVCNVLF